MYDKTEETHKEILSVKDQINELKTIINTVKLTAPIQAPKIERPKSVEQILGIQETPKP